MEHKLVEHKAGWQEQPLRAHLQTRFVSRRQRRVVLLFGLQELIAGTTTPSRLVKRGAGDGKL